MIRKIKDWHGWWDAMRAKMLKAGAESLVTNLTAMLGSNGVASMVPSLNDFALTWKVALFTTAFQFGTRVILAGAQYIAEKPEPETIDAPAEYPLTRDSKDQ